ncbi:MAG TPA: branched-chain amino acid ABC transporter permease [Anaeromyxobacteraceae bacterium]|nr:branched-chain amino acid ABC transporter permease [Anaeromyxobacteraceae bacterium]
MIGSRRNFVGLGIALVALGLVAPVLPKWLLSLVTIALGQGLVALGLLLLMRAGLVSFGQGLYFATGAYAVGLASERLGLKDAALQVLLGGLAAAAMAAALGLLLARYRAIFFAMLSLAFSMILYGILVKSAALGSTDGFGVTVHSVLGLDAREGLGRYGVYALSALCAFAAAVGIDRFLGSYLGRLGPAVRDNELRVEYMGASVHGVVYVNLVLAAALAGVGGALTALEVGHIDPEMAYWTTSGEFVFVAILSGTSSVAAPFLGAFLLVLLRSYAKQHAPNTWQLVMGATMLAVILFLPEGLWSIFRGRKRRTA